MSMSESGKIRLTPYLNRPVLASGKPASGPPIRVDDSALIRQAQQGNTAAFEELVRQYDRAVLRLAIHLTGSPEDGQDIYQEAFLRAYINLARFRFECSFYTWIYRIVTNLCLDHLRKKHSRGRDLNTTSPADVEQEDLLDRMRDHSPNASPERSFAGRELQQSIERRQRFFRAPAGFGALCLRGSGDARHVERTPHQYESGRTARGCVARGGEENLMDVAARVETGGVLQLLQSGLVPARA